MKFDMNRDIVYCNFPNTLLYMTHTCNPLQDSLLL